MRHSHLLVGFSVALVCATPALAQFGPTLDEKTTVVEELVVRGYGGPPWWKVSDPDTTLYILADPGDLPPGVDFNQRLLTLRMTGANAFIVQPRFTIGLGLVLAAPRGLKLVNQMNGSTKTSLEPSLPPDLRPVSSPRERPSAGRRRAMAPSPPAWRAWRWPATPISPAERKTHRRRKARGRWRASSSRSPRPRGSGWCP